MITFSVTASAITFILKRQKEEEVRKRKKTRKRKREEEERKEEREGERENGYRNVEFIFHNHLILIRTTDLVY